MKVLSLSNGKNLSFTDSSTIYDLVQVVETFGEIDFTRNELTKENLDGATFNNEPVENIIPVGVTVEAEMTGNITVHFGNRNKTAQEIIDEEQDAAINMLMGL